MITHIKAKKDLYNAGLCFKKGNIYELPQPVQTLAGLMEMTIDNDLGQPHIIGSFWRDFTGIKSKR
jgi:hypothetical protein